MPAIYEEKFIVEVIKEIIKKDKNLKSLGPTKRPIILNKLKRSGYVNLNMLELTRIINTYFKN